MLIYNYKQSTGNIKVLQQGCTAPVLEGWTAFWYLFQPTTLVLALLYLSTAKSSGHTCVLRPVTGAYTDVRSRYD